MAKTNWRMRINYKIGGYKLAIEFDDELAKKLADTMEGVQLGLQASAEVLKKMDERLSKQEKKDEEEKEKKLGEEKKKNDEESLTKMAQRAAELVLSELKKQQTQEKHPIKTDPEHQQDALQGADKEKCDEEYEEKKAVAKQDEEKEKEEEYEEKKAEDKEKKDEEKEYPEVEKLRKEIAELKKELAERNEDVIKKEVESRLRKAGFKEENSLKGPRRVELGADDNIILKSGSIGEAISGLSKLSWRKLTELKKAEEEKAIPEELRQMLR